MFAKARHFAVKFSEDLHIKKRKKSTIPDIPEKTLHVKTFQLSNLLTFVNPVDCELFIAFKDVKSCLQSRD